MIDISEALFRKRGGNSLELSTTRRVLRVKSIGFVKTNELVPLKREISSNPGARQADERAGTFQERVQEW